MPTLKQLTCRIELAPTNSPLPEFGTVYGDGLVETFVPVPEQRTPFHVHLTSSGYIAPGLAVYLYRDGERLCNRTRTGLIEPAADTTPSKDRSVLDMYLRQEETVQPVGIIHARELFFEKLKLVSGDAEAADFLKDRREAFGTIEVVVYRCRARLHNEDLRRRPFARLRSFRFKQQREFVSPNDENDRLMNSYDGADEPELELRCRCIDEAVSSSSEDDVASSTEDNVASISEDDVPSSSEEVFAEGPTEKALVTFDGPSEYADDPYSGLYDRRYSGFRNDGRQRSYGYENCDDYNYVDSRRGSSTCHRNTSPTLRTQENYSSWRFSSRDRRREEPRPETYYEAEVEQTDEDRRFSRRNRQQADYGGQSQHRERYTYGPEHDHQARAFHGHFGGAKNADPGIDSQYRRRSDSRQRHSRASVTSGRVHTLTPSPPRRYRQAFDDGATVQGANVHFHRNYPGAYPESSEDDSSDKPLGPIEDPLRNHDTGVSEHAIPRSPRCRHISPLGGSRTPPGGPKRGKSVSSSGGQHIDRTESHPRPYDPAVRGAGMTREEPPEPIVFNTPGGTQRASHHGLVDSSNEHTDNVARERIHDRGRTPYLRSYRVPDPSTRASRALPTPAAARHPSPYPYSFHPRRTCGHIPGSWSDDYGSISSDDDYFIPEEPRGILRATHASQHLGGDFYEEGEKPAKVAREHVHFQRPAVPIWESNNSLFMPNPTDQWLEAKVLAWNDRLSESNKEDVHEIPPNVNEAAANRADAEEAKGSSGPVESKESSSHTPMPANSSRVRSSIPLEPPKLTTQPYYSLGARHAGDESKASKKSLSDAYIAPEEPLLSVPETVAREIGIDHQVQAGPAAKYAHRTEAPVYLDAPSEGMLPYAVFKFKYRGKEIIEQTLNIKIGENGEILKINDDAAPEPQEAAGKGDEGISKAMADLKIDRHDSVVGSLTPSTDRGVGKKVSWEDDLSMLAEPGNGVRY